jgi:hypothetical protein
MNPAKLLPVLVWLAGSAIAAPPPPRMLFQGPAESLALLRLPDGSFAFYNRLRPAEGPFTLPDQRGDRHALRPHLPPAILGQPAVLDSGLLANTQAILTPEGRLVSVLVRGESLDPVTARQVGLARYLDLWAGHADARAVTGLHRVWRGYNGSQMEYQQLPDGRILVPFGSMQPHARAVPPTGRHVTIALRSDDAGETWQETGARLVAPCYPGFNGNNEGACEPTLEPLRDGRLWMLLRTQAGFLYETFSTDRGQSWSPATASRFHTSTGPANLLRHRNGWLVVAWNNCELPLRHQGQGVYGGRDALHIAVSDDDGRTWRGFREIYLDFRRNDNPERSGDRGTAYPLGAYTEDGHDRHPRRSGPGRAQPDPRGPGVDRRDRRARRLFRRPGAVERVPEPRPRRELVAGARRRRGPGGRSGTACRPGACTSAAPRTGRRTSRSGIFPTAGKER